LLIHTETVGSGKERSESIRIAAYSINRQRFASIKPKRYSLIVSLQIDMKAVAFWPRLFLKEVPNICILSYGA
jgi:hypothetical protein